MTRGLKCCASPSRISCRPLLTRASIRSFSPRGSALSLPDTASPSNNSTAGEPRAPKKKKKKKQRPRTVFSGIQPTGVPHLGNYLGALREWKQYQDRKIQDTSSTRDRLIFSIVDLHALTNPQDSTDLLRNRRETFASLLAIGLDPKYSHIFYQSRVPGHAQLMWYLSTVASTGYLSRMTQWKSKLGVSEDADVWDKEAREKLRLGLFSYPVLQAADILLYNVDLVPVGEDQQQHVEFARNLARSFNARYPTAQNKGRGFFREPKLVMSPARRVMSLKNPTVKMSKSDPDPNSRILITDDEQTIHDKIKGALTDSTTGISYDPTNRPGVSNLVEILKHVDSNEATCEVIAQDHASHSMRAFKEHVAQRIVVCLDGVRDRFLQLNEPNCREMEQAHHQSMKIVSSVAGETMRRLDEVMGLRDPHQRSKTDSDSKAEKRRFVMQEQEELEAQNEPEPDVTPQKNQGVDIPIAS